MLAGGNPDGVVQGAGGSATFTLGEGGAASMASSSAITIHIRTFDWADEIAWNVDGGQYFGEDPPYNDNTDYYQSMVLSTGEHSFNYFDSYGDGWHGGWWEILPGSIDASNAAGVVPIAGGERAGLVEGAGGSTAFTLGTAAGAAGARRGRGPLPARVVLERGARRPSPPSKLYWV